MFQIFWNAQIRWHSKQYFLERVSKNGHVYGEIAPYRVKCLQSLENIKLSYVKIFQKYNSKTQKLLTLKAMDDRGT